MKNINDVTLMVKLLVGAMLFMTIVVSIQRNDVLLEKSYKSLIYSYKTLANHLLTQI